MLPQMNPNTFGGFLRDADKENQANALLRQQVNNAQLENQYFPMIKGSEAASKLAYSQLMGPQFMAKLMGNEDILANLSPEQRSQALNMIYRAGLGQNNATQNPFSSPIEKTVNNVNKAFGYNNGQQAQQKPINSLLNQPNLSTQDRADISDQKSVVIQGNKPENNNSYAENVGIYKGIKKELEELGKIRADDIKYLDDIVYNEDIKLDTLNDIGKMISSPEIRNIRQLPLAGRHEMGFYAKEGTPAQQQLIGRLFSQMGNVVKDSARDFAGQFRKGEQQLLLGMKPNDSDTVDVMIGKAESLTAMAKLLRERSALTSKYIKENHISKGDALEFSNKQLNADQIINSIHNKLNPKPTEDDIQYMAEKYKKTPDEIKKQLKDKGIL